MSLLKCTWLSTLLIFSLHAIAQQPAVHEFSVKDCVDYGLKNNVRVKNALLDIEIQKQDNRVTTARALPALNGAGGYTDNVLIQTQLLPGEFFGQLPGTYVPVKFGTQYTASGSVTLQQTLFDGEVFIGLQARKVSIDYRQKAAALTQDIIRANIYKIYYQLVVSKVQIEQLNANISRAQNLLHVNSELFKNGFAEKLDENRSAVQLANFETEKLRSQSQIDNGYYGLKLLMGMPEKDSLVLTDSVTEDQLKQGLLNEGVYDYNNRNDYLFYKSLNQLNEFNVKRYKLSYYPTLSLTGNYARVGQGNDFNVFGKGQWFNSAYFGLNLAVPIFNGFSKNANVKEAELQLQQSQNTLSNIKDSIDNSVLQAINSYHSSIAALDYQKKNVALAEDVYNQSQKKYEAGLGATLDITNAQADLTIAQSNYVNAMYDAVIAQINYLDATGQLK
ncbi:MAG: TolC family protein [Parafilimonas sp.]